MNILILNNLELKTFTEQDTLDYCQLNDINPNGIDELDLSYNKITDISTIKNLKSVKDLNINNLELESDQIQYIKSLKKLKELYCRKAFKNKTVLNKLNKNINIRIKNERNRIKQFKIKDIY